MTELRSTSLETQISEIPVLSYEFHGGMEIQRVAVHDITDEPRNFETKEATQQEVANINNYLKGKPNLQAPEIDKESNIFYPNNPIAEWMYDTHEGLKTWRTKLVPSAIALTALYEAESWVLPTDEREPVDAATRAYFIHSLDAIGIRTRAAIMTDIAKNYPETDGMPTKWTSIACGGAIPVLNALESIRAQTNGVDLKLVDIDPPTLQHAKQKAGERSFSENKDFLLMERNVIKELIVSDNLVNELGYESQQLVDMLGIFEYIPEDFNGFKSAAAFLKNSFKLVKPGGALVAANMLDTHPQLDFNQRAIGWPKIFPRTIEQIHQIITDAGIEPTNVTMKIPEDGIYAVFEIRKQEDFDTTFAA